MSRARLIWIIVAVAVIVPLGFAATSPLLAFRDPIYIGAAFAGVIAMALLLVQPLLAGELGSRKIHRGVGALLVAMIALHVGGLWITSPPDVVDALLFQSPTPFSFWGVVAMWAVIATATLAMLRRKLRYQTWRRGHAVFALIIVLCTSAHALLIEGTMEPVSKSVLGALIIAATIKTVFELKVFAKV